MLKPFLCSAAIASLTLFSCSALAAADTAGNAIFVFGKADVVAADGSRRALTRGGELSEGDRVLTGANGRVQIRMSDGGLIALRPATEFLIEAFHYDEDPDVFATQTPVSFFALLKGGFRSITGAVGKKDKEAYRVRTPVATIGIRGTDYDAVYCAADCEPLSRALGKSLADGLYIGINSGAVVVVNDAGSIELQANEFGYTGGGKQAPARSDVAREVLAPATEAQVNEESLTAPAAAATVPDPVEESTPDTGVSSSEEQNVSAVVDFNTGVTTTVDNTGSVAFANVPGAGIGVSAAGRGDLQRNDQRAVDGFTSGDATFALDTAQSVNVGRDDERDGATGLSWGRWSNGSVNASADGATTGLDVDGSVHWIASEDNAPTPQVPVTGSRSFDLIGNTDPTDNQGNVGTLGSASLDANFDAQTVDADVSLSFAQTNQVWDASARDVDINSSDATFAGAFDDVTISDGVNTVDGSGGLSGFFSGDADGNIDGAGFAFGLSDDAGTDVSGSAAFQAAPDNN
ncbi:MAG: FecR domain-containing protein [Gammaproteobacteria bacterium]